MAYNPKLAVIDTRQLAENILNFIEDNQEIALEWASLTTEEIKPIAKFYNSAGGRLTTVFPALMVVKRSQATNTDDMLQTAYALDLELMVSGKDAETVTEKSAVYAMALESLLQNVRIKDFFDDAKVAANGNLDTLETEFDVLRGLNASGSAFLQITSFRAVWILNAGAQNN
jgi:hypothetical protein